MVRPRFIPFGCSRRRKLKRYIPSADGTELTSIPLYEEREVPRTRYQMLRCVLTISSVLVMVTLIPISVQNLLNAAPTSTAAGGPSPTPTIPPPLFAFPGTLTIIVGGRMERSVTRTVGFKRSGDGLLFPVITAEEEVGVRMNVVMVIVKMVFVRPLEPGMSTPP